VPLEPRAIYWNGVCALISGLGGGHILSRIIEGTPVFWGWLQFWDSSKNHYGAWLGGAVAGLAFLRVLKLPVLLFADAIAPAVSLGYAIGRIGCFLNGNDYGAPTHLPWAVVYPADTEASANHTARGWILPGTASSLPVHPIQLYASLLGLIMFVVLANWQPKQAGGRVAQFLFWYGGARFFMEYLRGGFRAVLGPLSLPQLFSLLFIAVGLGLRLGARREMVRNGNAPLGVSAPPGSVLA
jgi:phosphatidylglycerol:prolipoprotein diacylglycerol transferase